MTSIGVLAVVVVVAELLAELGSAVLELTEAVLEIVVPSVTAAPTLTTRVKTAVAPELKLEFVQVIVPVAPTAGLVQDQPVGAVIDLKVVFVGTVSVRVTLLAALGPPLAMVIV